MDSKTVETRHAPIRYLEGGSGEPLVYLHGAGGMTPDDPILKELSSRFHVYAPYLPGYGETEECGSLRDMLDFALHGWDVVEALGLKNPILVGHSMGGMTILALADQHPELFGERIVGVGLISTSTTQVDFGVKLVAETGESLARIVGKVSEINSVVADIAAGAEEQSTALQEVNTAVNAMDQATQQNAAMAEQATAAARSMMQETEKLSEMIGRFRLGRNASTGAMRRELKKVAPHAFAPTVKPPSRPSVSKAPAKPQPVRSPPKVAVNAPATAAAEEGWTEF